MGTMTGRTAGFGRIRVDTRPSPYTPVHLPSAPVAFVPPASLDRPPRRAGRASLAVAVLVLVAVLLAAGLFAKPRPDARAAVEAADAPGASV